MIWFILIGLLSGVVSGLGIGGGTVLIPALSIFFGLEQQQAQTINLIYFVPTAVIALTTHLKEGNVEKKEVGKLVLFGLVSAAAGSFIAIKINGGALRKIFGFFLLAMGVMEVFKKEPKTNAVGGG